VGESEKEEEREREKALTSGKRFPRGNHIRRKCGSQSFMFETCLYAMKSTKPNILKNSSRTHKK
jgi:hypothetical protein